jgi:hypothetical protein
VTVSVGYKTPLHWLLDMPRLVSRLCYHPLANINRMRSMLIEQQQQHHTTAAAPLPNDPDPDQDPVEIDEVDQPASNATFSYPPPEATIVMTAATTTPATRL